MSISYHLMEKITNTLINQTNLIYYRRKRQKIGVEMKSVQFDKQNRLCGRTTAIIPSRAGKIYTSFHHHGSVIVSTLVVKEHGESLLIKHPKATPWLAYKEKIYNTSRGFACIFSFLLFPKKTDASQFGLIIWMVALQHLLCVPSPLPLSNYVFSLNVINLVSPFLLLS